jgi:hypothetical protein
MLRRDLARYRLQKEFFALSGHYSAQCGILTLEHSRHLISQERNDEADQPGEGESQTEPLPELQEPLKWTVRSAYLLQLLMPARMRGRLVTIIHPFAWCFSIISLFLFESDEAW